MKGISASHQSAAFSGTAQRGHIIERLCIVEWTGEYLQFPERFHASEQQQMCQWLPGKQGHGWFAFFTDSVPNACQLFSTCLSFSRLGCIDSRNNYLYIKIRNRDVQLPRPWRTMAGRACGGSKLNLPTSVCSRLTLSYLARIKS